jgi:hypothetical protein
MHAFLDQFRLPISHANRKGYVRFSCPATLTETCRE